MREDTKTLTFAAGVCIVVSLLMVLCAIVVLVFFRWAGERE